MSTPIVEKGYPVTTLKAKVMLFVLAIACLATLPIELRADGNPIPQCGKEACKPPG
jgi:hypothetical protein